MLSRLLVVVFLRADAIVKSRGKCCSLCSDLESMVLMVVNRWFWGGRKMDRCLGGGLLRRARDRQCVSCT